jgi:hypothetical protein
LVSRKEGFVLVVDGIQIIRQENAIGLVHANGDEDSEEGTNEDAKLALPRYR